MGKGICPYPGLIIVNGHHHHTVMIPIEPMNV
jgi:hypothetical protein